MADKIAKTSKANKANQVKTKRLSKSQRIHNRRVKQASKNPVVTHT